MVALNKYTSIRFAGLVCLCAQWTAAQRVLRDPSAAKDAYDYIIAGGGLTGLVVANRLTEDPKTTVLVVEYGDLADSWNLSIPYYATALQDASLMFTTPSTPQRGLGGRTFNLPLGATVGGGSTVNGMAYLRGAKVDYDTWEKMGNRGWGWKEMSKYFKKSSTLNVPSPEIVDQLNYTYDKSSFGHGPVQALLPPWQWPDVYYLYKAWTEDMGYPLLNDSMSGNILGAAWRPISADGKNLTRSSARKAYYDPVQHRPNLQLLVNTYVAKVQIPAQGLSRAKGVDVFSRKDGSAKVSISARKEVILAAGGIHTPQILQLSGIGPRHLLDKLNIPVVEDLPGVGANFMDHPTLRGAQQVNQPNPINFSLLRNNASFFDAAWAEYMANRTGPLTAAGGNSGLTATLHNLTTNSDDTATNLIHTLITPANSTAYLPAHYRDKPTLVAGYAAQVSLLTSALQAGTNPLVDFLWSGNAPPGMAVVLQKPLSRGTVLINSTNPHPGLSPPLVDFNAFAHPFDARAMVLAFKLLRRVLLTSPSLRHLGVEELLPGEEAVGTDEEIEAALRGTLMSPHNAHPCGTAGMMPRELGGVVDERLKVYGVEGLRVVDASMLPVIVAANLQATMYAVAEKAADIIRGH
ncbi:GMC oxidoreductase [Parathielavia appendiculata]|uniref:GMC oxidoreductase n=1 Tax=Parathielavia appendiculata TaxID=2587402 RepID=A0AAN6U1P3_9PEZI|nr:GMC oxidoreductase [Parathielavia appendiculata]